MRCTTNAVNMFISRNVKGFLTRDSVCKLGRSHNVNFGIKFSELWDKFSVFKFVKLTTPSYVLYAIGLNLIAMILLSSYQ